MGAAFAAEVQRELQMLRMGGVEDPVCDPPGLASPQEVAPLHSTPRVDGVFLVLRTAEIKRIAGIHSREHWNVVRRTRKPHKECVEAIHVWFCGTFRGKGDALPGGAFPQLRHKRAISVRPPASTAKRVSVRNVVTGGWPLRRNLVEIDRLHADFTDETPTYLANLAAPERSRGAHRGEATPRAVFLDVKRLPVRLLASPGDCV